MTVHETALDEWLWLVQPEGRIDALAVPELEGAFRGLLERGAVSVVVDLSEATYISSSGLKAIVSTWRALRTRGGQLVLAGLGPRLREIFEMVGFTPIFKIYDDVAAAEAALRAVSP